MGRGVWIRFGVQSVLLAGIFLALAGYIPYRTTGDRLAGSWKDVKDNEANSMSEGVYAALTQVEARCGALIANAGTPRIVNETIPNILQECKMIDKEYISVVENLRNLDTPGYKRLFYTRNANGNDILPRYDFRQGSAESTGIWSDVMFGDASSFLAAKRPDGTTGYTRSGTLRLTANGELRTAEGFPLHPPVGTLPMGAIDPSINQNGTVQYIDARGKAKTVGQIRLYNFLNPAELSRGKDGYFLPTKESGSAHEGVAGDPGFGDLTSQWIEGSNVDFFYELSILRSLAQRLTVLQMQLDMATSK